MLLELCGLSWERGAILKIELSRKNRKTLEPTPETKRNTKRQRSELRCCSELCFSLPFPALAPSGRILPAPVSAPILNKHILNLRLSGEWQVSSADSKKELHAWLVVGRVGAGELIHKLWELSDINHGGLPLPATKMGRFRRKVLHPGSQEVPDIH